MKDEKPEGKSPHEKAEFLPNLLETTRQARNSPTEKNKKNLKENICWHLNNDESPLVLIAELILETQLSAPFNDTIEESLVGAMLVREEWCDLCLKELTLDHFASAIAQALFTCLGEMRAAGEMTGDIVLVWDWLKRNKKVTELSRALWGNLTEQGGMQMLSTCVVKATSFPEEYILRIKQMHVDRKRYVLAERLLSLLYSTKVGEWIAEAKTSLAAFEEEYQVVASEIIDAKRVSENGKKEKGELGTQVTQASH